MTMLTDDDGSDGEDDEAVPSQEALDVVLGDVLHPLPGPHGAQLYALPDLLHAAPCPRVLPVALGHSCTALYRSALNPMLDAHTPPPPAQQETILEKKPGALGELHLHRPSKTESISHTEDRGTPGIFSLDWTLDEEGERWLFCC